MLSMTDLNSNITSTTSQSTVIPLHCWCGGDSNSRLEDRLTLENVTGNITQPIEKASISAGSLFMNNWVVVLLISGTVLAFIAGLFIKRQQLIKDRQRREEQYLAYFHSILPHSRLYGKIETPEDGNGQTSKRNSKNKSKSKEMVKYSAQHGLIEVWENLSNLDTSNEEIIDMRTTDISKDQRSKKVKNKVLEKIDEGSEASQSIENEMSSGLSTTKLDIEIMQDSATNKEQRINMTDKSEMCEMAVLKDMSESEYDKEMNSQFTTTSDLQDSLCVIWI